MNTQKDHFSSNNKCVSNAYSLYFLAIGKCLHRKFSYVISSPLRISTVSLYLFQRYL